MQRYFIEENLIKENLIYVDDYNLKHMSKVMRYKNGDEVICILPDHKTYIYSIKDINEGILERKELLDVSHELDVDITLVYALVKGDKFEFVLQKATELGVKKVVPLNTIRSVIKTDQDKFSKKYERFNKILKEAAEQSYREYIPELTPLTNVKGLKEYLSDINLVAYEESSKQGESSNFYQFLHKPYQSITIIVGPEGGFDQKEIDEMESMGIVPCSLGKRILRSETAPLYMLSVIGYSRELEK